MLSAPGKNERGRRESRDEKRSRRGRCQKSLNRKKGWNSQDRSWREGRPRRIRLLQRGILTQLCAAPVPPPPPRPFLSLLALISRGREREGGREGEQQFLVSAGRTEGRTPQLKLLSRARTKVNYAFRRNAAPVNRARTPRRLCPHSRGLTRCISCAQEAVA